VDVTEFWQRRCDAGQLGFLLGVGERDATHAVGVAALAQGGMVDRTTEQQGAFKPPLLLRSRFEFVRVSLANAAALLLQIPLFSPRGARAATRWLFVARQGHPAFLPLPTRRRLAPDYAKIWYTNWYGTPTSAIYLPDPNDPRVGDLFKLRREKSYLLVVTWINRPEFNPGGYWCGSHYDDQQHCAGGYWNPANTPALH
jgi:hypothetical protein